MVPLLLPFSDEHGPGLRGDAGLGQHFAGLLILALQALDLAARGGGEFAINLLLQPIGDAAREEVGRERRRRLAIDALLLDAQVRRRHRRQRSQFFFERHCHQPGRFA